MNKKLKQFSAWLLMGAIAALVFIILLLVSASFTARLDKISSDWFFKWRGERPGNPDAVFVDIDDKAIQDLKIPFPIPRHYYADLVESLSGAKAVAFDIFLTDPSPVRPQDMEQIKDYMTNVIVSEIFREKMGSDALLNMLKELSRSIPANADTAKKYATEIEEIIKQLPPDKPIDTTSLKQKMRTLVVSIIGREDMPGQTLYDFAQRFAPGAAKVLALVKILDKTPDRRLSESVGKHGHILFPMFLPQGSETGEVVAQKIKLVDRIMEAFHSSEFAANWNEASVQSKALAFLQSKLNVTAGSLTDVWSLVLEREKRNGLDFCVSVWKETAGANASAIDLDRAATQIIQNKLDQKIMERAGKNLTKWGLDNSKPLFHAFALKENYLRKYEDAQSADKLADEIVDWMIATEDPYDEPEKDDAGKPSRATKRFLSSWLQMEIPQEYSKLVAEKFPIKTEDLDSLDTLFAKRLQRRVSEKLSPTVIKIISDRFDEMENKWRIKHIFNPEIYPGKGYVDTIAEDSEDYKLRERALSIAAELGYQDFSKDFNSFDDQQKRIDYFNSIKEDRLSSQEYQSLLRHIKSKTLQNLYQMNGDKYVGITNEIIQAFQKQFNGYEPQRAEIIDIVANDISVYYFVNGTFDYFISKHMGPLAKFIDDQYSMNRLYSEQDTDVLLRADVVKKRARPLKDGETGLRATEDITPDVLWYLEKTAMPCFAQILQDPIDGTVREYPLVLQYGKGAEAKVFPALGFAAALIYLKVDFKDVEIQLGKHLRIPNATLRDGSKKDIVIPIDHEGKMIINWAGTWENNSVFKHYKLTDFIPLDRTPEERERVRINSEKLKGKIAFVGLTATGSIDFNPMPFQSRYPMVGSHANVFNTVVEQQFLKRHSRTNTILILLLASLIVAVCTGAFSRHVSLFMTTLFICGYVAFTFAFFEPRIFDMVYTVGAMLLAFFMLVAYKYMVEEKGARVMEGMFAKRTSPLLVQRLKENPAALNLGGNNVEATIFFSDMAGFSSISEGMPPEELVALLNDYLTDMTSLCLAQDAYIDKYIGDAIMADFGVLAPDPDHAKKACFAALDNMKRLKEIQPALREKYGKDVSIRIGLNSGTVTAANMGSEQRSDFTVIGDEVNLASRLEGANKNYGTSIMIEDSTYSLAKDFIEVRLLDMIAVKGKSLPSKVYELACRKGELSPEQSQCFRLYEEAMKLHWERKFTEAIKKLEEALTHIPDDSPSKIMIDRCRYYLENPPADDWDGVLHLKTK